MNYKLVSASGTAWNAMSIEIVKPGSHIPIVVFVTQDYADTTAKSLSNLLPECEVTITLAARIKARYKGGVRKEVRDFKSLYTNFTEEQYQASNLVKKILFKHTQHFIFHWRTNREHYSST